MSAKKMINRVLAGISNGTVFGVMLKSKKTKAVRKTLHKYGHQYSVVLKEKFDTYINGLQNGLSKLDMALDRLRQLDENSEVAQVTKKERISNKYH